MFGDEGWFKLRKTTKLIVEYPEKVPVNNGMAEFEVITVFPRELDVALVEVWGLGESFREVVYNSDTSIILVDYVNPPPGRHEFKVNVYRANSLLYTYRFHVEFIDDPLGTIYTIAERVEAGYHVYMDVEVNNPPVELYVDANIYHALSYYKQVFEHEEKIDRKGTHRIDLGIFDLEKHSLEIVVVCVKKDLEWRRIIVLPEIT